MDSDVTMPTSVARTARSLLLRLALTLFIVVAFALSSRAGGPKSVAGTSFFDPSVTGVPLTWPQGQIRYYTDQGDLSPILPNAAANSLVADAFSQWSSVPTAALAITTPGQLAEDVNGANVTLNADGTISMPADIQPSATGTPVGIIYDSDGSVTDALLGAGAGDPTQCFAHAAFGGNDNYGSLASYQHALIVINGQCAQQSSQLVDVEYRLVRAIGAVLGLGWSQVNPNVITGQPHATADDYAGFPVMHYTDQTGCVPVTRCYANPYHLTMDDAATLSRLYPVTAQNYTSFPGKSISSSVTARIHGSVWFTDRFGNRTQPMQGVNVVARWIDPTTLLPSRRYAISSVSGFLFSGDEGNPITGLEDPLQDPFSEWGSDSAAVEGFFDLSGLQFPTGSYAQYQLSVEPVDPSWATGVGPYAPYQVAPSGSFQPIVISLIKGEDLQQDILMQTSAPPVSPWFTSDSWTSPAPVPLAGDWGGSLGSYGDVGYFSLPVQANRTLSVAVNALDERGQATETKLQPVIAMWTAADPQGTPPPAFTTSPFNTTTFGATRLDVQASISSNFLIGIADLRGDGRPDYRYDAQVLYADSLAPARVGVNGGPVTVLGTGFSPGSTAAVGNTSATPLSISAGRIILSVPRQTSDGTQNITINNPVNGAATSMTNALTVGAAATDTIVLVSGMNPLTPVGAQAANPMTVRVLQSDGITPVSGATVGWSGTNGLQLSACGGLSACSVLTDQFGQAFTWLTPSATGNANVSATLAPGVYSPSKSVNASLVASESSSDIGLLSQYFWALQGSNAAVPLTARVLSNGVPQANAKVNFTIVNGSGSLSSPSAQTNSSGYATVTLNLTQFATPLLATACVAPANAPCLTFYGQPVSPATLKLQPVAGAGQISTAPSFQPVVVRVTDSSAPPNPVLGATVTFLTTVLRAGGTSPGGGNGDTNTSNPAMPVILKVSQASVLSDANGLASIVPSSAGWSAPVEVDVAVTAGSNAMLDFPLQLLPALSSGNGAQPPVARSPLRIRWPPFTVQE